MKRVLIFILSLLLLFTVSCISTSPIDMDIVGCWVDVEYPDIAIQFTQYGEFFDYYGERITSGGTFETDYPNLALYYHESDCGDNGIDCIVNLNYTTTTNSLIISDIDTDYYYTKIDCP